MTRRILISIIGFLSVIALSWYAYTNNVGIIYSEYRKLFTYRRLHPDFLPNTQTLRLSSAGHVTTYADIIWMQLVQYIGDNYGNERYKLFVNSLVHTINTLHPHFISPYNLALILTPSLNPENKEFELNREIAIVALSLGEKGILTGCDSAKMSTILSEEVGKNLWENTLLRNPCRDGLLPYNTAYVAQELGYVKKAEEYYKIASMNDDAPLASRFLGPLMRAKEGDHKEAAQKFLLIAIDGYDEEPYFCRDLSLKLIQDIREKNLGEIVSTLRNQEDQLIEPKDTKNPLSNSATSCHSSVLRSMKQIYLAYIQEISLGLPEVKSAKELLERGIIDFIPSIKEQDGWNIVRESGGNWRYQKPF